RHRAARERGEGLHLRADGARRERRQCARPDRRAGGAGSNRAVRADRDVSVAADEEARMDEDAGEGRLDGNAAGGVLAMAFGREMTAVPGQCAHCHTINEMGAMHVYMAGPGMVMRCPACGQVVLRVVETSSAMLIDAHGIAYVRIERER